ncbi:MAG: hypothetical protein MZU91_14435 [Desulfosudis oleivorans]|nr:hypothetical protein [Desulfosudis oleivorans]
MRLAETVECHRTGWLGGPGTASLPRCPAARSARPCRPGPLHHLQSQQQSASGSSRPARHEGRPGSFRLRPPAAVPTARLHRLQGHPPPSPGTAASAVQKSPAAPESGRVREIYARQGDEVQIGARRQGVPVPRLRQAFPGRGDRLQGQGDPRQQEHLHVQGREAGHLRPGLPSRTTRQGNRCARQSASTW